MLEKFSDKLLQQLKGEIAAAIVRETDAFKRLSAILKLIRSALAALKGYILEHPFKSIAEEVHFFKNIKPSFYCLRIFYLEKYNVETSVPVGDSEALKGFYQDELKAAGRFFQQNCFQHQYYRLGASELDELYFVRGVEVQSVLIPEMPEPDPEFSTGCDYLFSKIRAYELLRDYIMEQLQLLEPSPVSPAAKTNKIKPLVWTGESINLVELGYGLYDTGQLNNGEAGVNDIFTWLAEHFQVSIGIPARRFVEIKRRKRLSRTRFLDNMREAINNKIDEDERYDPDKLKAKSERRKMGL